VSADSVISLAALAMCPVVVIILGGSIHRVAPETEYVSVREKGLSPGLKQDNFVLEQYRFQWPLHGHT
jgi:hypothetical protein